MSLYHDRLNRPVRSAQGFIASGTPPWIYADTEYDNQGRVVRSSRPYFAGSTPTVHWNVNQYDALGRVQKTFLPDAPAVAAVVVAYNGQSIRRTNRKNQTTTDIHNSQGAKLRVTAAANQSTDFKKQIELLTDRQASSKGVGGRGR